MSDAVQVATIKETELRFPSLASLRSAHTDLIKRYRELGTAPDLLAEIADFVRSGSESGALLDDDDDRACGHVHSRCFPRRPPKGVPSPSRRVPSR